MIGAIFAPAKDKVRFNPYEADHAWDTLVQASTFAESTDGLYLFIVWLSVFFFILVIGTMFYFMWKYRRLSEDQKTSSITHNGKIEFLWSAIPAVLLIVIFIWGEVDFIKQSAPPADAIDIRVTGQKWFWTVEYPDYPGVQLSSSNTEASVTLVVPKDRPVRLTMASKDVLHSFYVPAFRVKRDVVPGRYTTLWFEANKLGTFNMYCAEYCGDQHSSMIGVVRVVSPERFKPILEELGKLEREENESMADYGQRIYKRRGCAACHTTDGSEATGPTWQGLYGKREQLSDGSTVECDDNYIKESILEPNAKVVAGFPAQMPSYDGQLNDEQITAVIEYIKTL